MEVIRLSGYDIPEKIAIARTYLVPKALLEAGLTSIPGFNVTISDDALDALVRNHCRESGVRSLEKTIEKIARKIAFNMVTKREANILADASSLLSSLSPSSTSETINIDANNLDEYVGKPRFSQDTIYDSGSEALPVGVVMGLAWNPLGGSPVFIETAGRT